MICVIVIANIYPAVMVFAAAAPSVYAESYCIMDADTGEIIAEKYMDTTYRPASITKILTALVAIENCEDLNDTITFSHNAVTSITSDSSTLIPTAREGEVMTVRDVLYGMMLASGNECANAIAEYIAGSVENFAVLMNQKAQELGAVSSRFVNPHGLDVEGHYTTAYDMALIFRAAMQNPIFYQIDTTPYYTIEATNLTAARNLEMGHKMIRGEYACEGVFAGKTGSTKLAGRTLVTMAKRNDRSIITVIMKSTEAQFYNDTAKLLDYGYKLLAENDAVRQSEEQITAHVELNEARSQVQATASTIPSATVAETATAVPSTASSAVVDVSNTDSTSTVAANSETTFTLDVAQETSKVQEELLSKYVSVNEAGASAVQTETPTLPYADLLKGSTETLSVIYGTNIGINKTFTAYVVDCFPWINCRNKVVKAKYQKESTASKAFNIISDKTSETTANSDEKSTADNAVTSTTAVNSSGIDGLLPNTQSSQQATTNNFDELNMNLTN